MESCVCIYDEDEGPSPCSVLFRTARKKHVCCECGKTILPGEKYEQVNGCWDGSWGCYKTCSLCKRMRDDLFPCGFIYTQLYNLIEEHFGTNPTTGEYTNDVWFDEREKYLIQETLKKREAADE